MANLTDWVLSPCVCYIIMCRVTFEELSAPPEGFDLLFDTPAVTNYTITCHLKNATQSYVVHVVHNVPLKLSSV